jgi:tetratricopeptide (TPR) repeat protein
MKKKLIIILIFCNWTVYSQEIILSEKVKQYYKAHEATLETSININNKKEGAIQDAIEKYEYFFEISDIDDNKDFGFYASLLAQSGDLQKAVAYYEKAIKLKKKTAKDFDNHYIKKLFEKDTVLYNQKKKEFYEIPLTYTVRELELLFEVKQMFAADQLARYYHDDHPQYKNCSKNILVYVDSITMVKLVKLIEKYPEYSNPLNIDPLTAWFIGRHIFTAYPEFWLTYFEPRTREDVINGKGYPKEYARTYDRCIITSGKEKYSYYGEWDDEGKAVNPDKELVNQRRANLGLPPLEEKKTNPNEFFITY